MDETACWMDMPCDTTVDLTGTRSIPVKTTDMRRTTLQLFSVLVLMEQS